MTKSIYRHIVLYTFLLLVGWQCSRDHDHNLPEVVDFNFHVRPILSNNCYTCHGPDGASRKAGLRLDTREGATMRLASGERAIVPGNVRKSTLMDRLLSHEAEVMMPPPESKKKLTNREVQLIGKWIQQGAKWKKHWAFITPKPEPELKSIDAYIEEKYEEKGLKTNERATNDALLRRLSFVLTGLPPSLADQETFKNRPYEEVVDYYLNSPHFGEHWARHWMDLVRYAEGMGHEFDFEIGGASHYRDYLIRAFNQDLPYDELVLEHIAGDLLEQRIDSTSGIRESIIGTAYAFLGEGKHSPVDIKQEETNRIDNLIDVTSKTFLGLTVSCAKCHDHKFDPIPTTDYYAMYGMFESSRIGPISIVDDSKFSIAVKESKAINRMLKDSIRTYIEQLEYKVSGNAKVLGDFSQGTFGAWRTNGVAFGDKPLFNAYASSRTIGPGMLGSLRSPTFTIQDSFLHIIARGQSASIRIIVDNFQLIQSPLYGNLSQELFDDQWDVISFNLENVIGHKAYIEILPGVYRRHHYELDSAAYVEVRHVYSSQDSKEISTKEFGTRELASEFVRQHREEKALHTRSLQRKYIMGLADAEAIFSPVFLRGNYQTPSKEKVPHSFLHVLSDQNSAFSQKGSGRLEWAKAVIDPSNPLTARVMVNRIWHHLFGQGIVKSVDNFGLQGSLPSHPELLDALAVRFIKNGWSIKSLIRDIVLSEAFQLKTGLSKENKVLDPENLYLSAYPIRRLEAESVRDAILQAANNLDTDLYGPSIPVYLTDFMTGRGRPSVSGPLDGNGRRSIYLQIKRNFLSPMMLTFDMPIPFSTFGRRNETNVPAQSLFLMNDMFVHEYSRKWAEDLLERLEDPEVRIERLYQRAFSRLPDDEERKRIMKMIEDFKNEELSELEVWTDLCHIMYNSKEFIYLL